MKLDYSRLVYRHAPRPIPATAATPPNPGPLVAVVWSAGVVVGASVAPESGELVSVSIGDAAVVLGAEVGDDETVVGEDVSVGGTVVVVVCCVGVWVG